MTPLRQYHELINNGTLQGDDHQTRIIQKLQDLHDNLVNYQPPPIPEAASSTSLVSMYALAYGQRD